MPCSKSASPTRTCSSTTATLALAPLVNKMSLVVQKLSARKTLHVWYSLSSGSPNHSPRPRFVHDFSDPSKNFTSLSRVGASAVPCLLHLAFLRPCQLPNLLYIGTFCISVNIPISCTLTFAYRNLGPHLRRQLLDLCHIDDWPRLATYHCVHAAPSFL